MHQQQQQQQPQSRPRKPPPSSCSLPSSLLRGRRFWSEPTPTPHSSEDCNQNSSSSPRPSDRVEDSARATSIYLSTGKGSQEPAGIQPRTSAFRSLKMVLVSSSRSTLILGGAVSLLGLGVRAGWPIKTVDLTNSGDYCDRSKDQYLQVEAHDFHDHPKLTMRWRQITGPCGKTIEDSALLSWEAHYDGSRPHAGDDPPTAGDAGRVQLNLYVCAPFGDYELDMDIDSYSGPSSTLQQRTSWLIKNGPDQHHIWDTVNTDLASDGDYSPTAPGEYTWPFQGATDYYTTLIAGPLPPLECASSVPIGTALLGCFADPAADRLLGSDSLVLTKRGPGGMTAQICSDFCSGFDFFGLEFGGECFCGTVEDIEDNYGMSDQCGLSSAYLCTGDPTTACGGRNAISVYQRTEFAFVGCFQDDQASRIMGPKGKEPVMSAEICSERCNDGVNTHFGTQYGSECWCTVNANLMKNGGKLATHECDMPCAGTTSGELCGGEFKMSAYEIEHEHDETAIDATTPGYVGCYKDDASSRALNEEGKYVPGDMTNEVCIDFCADHGHAYAGTQFSQECWCGESLDLHGKISNGLCSSPCEGDDSQVCGGSYALSVYATDYHSH